jgi:hypothetical protein
VDGKSQKNEPSPPGNLGVFGAKRPPSPPGNLGVFRAKRHPGGGGVFATCCSKKIAMGVPYFLRGVCRVCVKRGKGVKRRGGDWVKTQRNMANNCRTHFNPLLAPNRAMRNAEQHALLWRVGTVNRLVCQAVNCLARHPVTRTRRPTIRAARFVQKLTPKGRKMCK